MTKLKYSITILPEDGIDSGPSYYKFYHRKIDQLRKEGYTIRKHWANWIMFTCGHHYVDSVDATILALRHPEIMLYGC